MWSMTGYWYPIKDRELKTGEYWYSKHEASRS